jgi:serine/threonine protein kinase
MARLVDIAGLAGHGPAMNSASTVPEPLREALAERYAIERELGAGGMATVYLAHDVRHERPVAVKVFRPEVGASFGAERFAREIKLLARLRHPFILPLLDSGEAAGALYFVMPYIDGESLRARLVREGRLPIAKASCIGMSNRRMCSSRDRATPSSPTSASPAAVRRLTARPTS